MRYPHPSDSVLSFLITAFVSFFFQFASFVLTYLIHTTHPVKFSSRAGLGLTLILYGGSFGRVHGVMGIAEDSAANGEDMGALSMADVITKLNNTRFTDPALLDGTAYPFDMPSFNASDPNAVFELQFVDTSLEWVVLILMTLTGFCCCPLPLDSTTQA